MFDPASVRFKGPLMPHVDGFWSELMGQGYAPLSGRNLLLVAAHVSRWLADRKLGSGDLTDERIAQFTVHRRRKGYTQFLTPRALEPLIRYLRAIDVAPPPSISAETPVDRLLREYGEYLVQQRGLVASTIRCYMDLARYFIATEFDGDVLDWRGLTAGQLLHII